MDLGGLFGGIGSALLTTVKVAAPVVVNGLIVKHGDKVFAKVGLNRLGKVFHEIPNNAIPYLNLALGTAIGRIATGDMAAGAAYGVQAMTSGIAVHQLTKIGLRTIADKVIKKKGEDSWVAKAAAVVGPGKSLSI